MGKFSFSFHLHNQDEESLKQACVFMAEIAVGSDLNSQQMKSHLGAVAKRARNTNTVPTTKPIDLEKDEEEPLAKRTK